MAKLLGFANDDLKNELLSTSTRVEAFTDLYKLSKCCITVVGGQTTSTSAGLHFWRTMFSPVQPATERACQEL